MRKTCVIPKCRRAETGRESYFKFPLHDKLLLRKWLRNMRVKSFFPKKKQYLCSRHFRATSFEIRCGNLYLREKAVPTIFSRRVMSGRVRVTRDRVRVTKARRLSSTQNLGNKVSTVAPSSAGDQSVSTSDVSVDGAEVLVEDPDPITVDLLPEVNLVESSDELSLSTSEGFQLPPDTALTIEVLEEDRSVQHNSLEEPVGFLSEDNVLQENSNDPVPDAIGMAGYFDSIYIIEEEAATEVSFEGLPPVTPAEMTTEDVASYLQTMHTATLVPVQSSGPMPSITPSQETILSDSISSPIPSTVPIVLANSEDVPSVALYEEHPMEPLDEFSETDSIDELMAKVIQLQNQLTALHQRSQRHHRKLEILENVVEEFKNEDAMRDTLNFLADVCLCPAHTETEENQVYTVHYENGDQTVVYVMPCESENHGVLHITEP